MDSQIISKCSRCVNLLISLICAIVAIVGLTIIFGGCAPKTIQGDCVPRAFFNATAWGIANKCPVYIADFKGHWQAVGEHEGELHFLRGEHWLVWAGDKEGAKLIVKLWNLRDAMDHYLRHNPWVTTSKSEEEQLNKRIKAMLNRR